MLSPSLPLAFPIVNSSALRFEPLLAACSRLAQTFVGAVQQCSVSPSCIVTLEGPFLTRQDVPLSSSESDFV